MLRNVPKCFKILQNVPKRIQYASEWHPDAPKCVQNDSKSLHLGAFWIHFRAFWSHFGAFGRISEPFWSILPPFCSIFYHFPALCSTSMHFEVAGIGPERARRIPKCATPLFSVILKNINTYIYAGGAPGLAPYCAYPHSIRENPIYFGVMPLPYFRDAKFADPTMEL